MKSRISSIVLAASAAAVLVSSPAFAQQQAAPGQGAATKEELAQNFQAEHEIGRRYHFDPNDLPPPKTGPIVADRSLIVPYDGQKLEVPPGFTAAPFVTGPRQSAAAARAAQWRRAGRRAERRLSDPVARRRRGPRQMDRPPCRGPQPALRPGAAGRRDPRRRPGRASGACRTSSAHCGPAARCRRRRPTTCRPTSASRCRGPMARSC